MVPLGDGHRPRRVLVHYERSAPRLPGGTAGGPALRDPGAAGPADHVLFVLGVLRHVGPGPDGEARAYRLADPVLDGPRHVIDAHQVACHRAHGSVIGR
ncbi:hypothetical protein [Streptomyces sp. NPDC005262]|uniref:hypothetical protein n=1 Tax=Streptomyces sp. NPDC005262 TaxID=3364710 RepID=UPI0036C257B2